MTNTIDLLESIGQDASLRHASSANLATALSERDASDALKQAAMTGDNASLTRELGASDANHASNVHAPAHEDDEQSDEADDADEPQDGSVPEAPRK